jgi:hypothetical protein
VIGKGSAEKDRGRLCGRLEFLLVNDGCTQERRFLDISTFVTPLASIFEALSDPTGNMIFDRLDNGSTV